MIKNIFFDLDGTLITMDQDEFIKIYFYLIGNKMSEYGFDKEVVNKALYAGIISMFKSYGDDTNEEVFWNTFDSYFDKKDHDKLVEIFTDFYEHDFDFLKQICPPIEEAVNLIKYCKEKGYKIILATNPLFPRIATLKRVMWAGLNASDFDEITTYENHYFVKPDTRYFLTLLDRHHLKAEETLMVGNNVKEDMPARKIGMDTFLLTDQLINPENEDISNYRHGSFKELKHYLMSIDTKRFS